MLMFCESDVSVVAVPDVLTKPAVAAKPVPFGVQLKSDVGA